MQKEQVTSKGEMMARINDCNDDDNYEKKSGHLQLHFIQCAVKISHFDWLRGIFH